MGAAVNITVALSAVSQSQIGRRRWALSKEVSCYGQLWPLSSSSLRNGARQGLLVIETVAPARPSIERPLIHLLCARVSSCAFSCVLILEGNPRSGQLQTKSGLTHSPGGSSRRGGGWVVATDMLRSTLPPPTPGAVQTSRRDAVRRTSRHCS